MQGTAIEGEKAKEFPRSGASHLFYFSLESFPPTTHTQDLGSLDWIPGLRSLSVRHCPQKGKQTRTLNLDPP